MRLSARIAGIFFTFLTLAYCLVPTLAFAQAQNPYSSLIPVDANVPMNISTLTQGVLLGMLSATTCVLGGIDFSTPNHKCLTFNAQTGRFSYAHETGGGILGLEAGGITLLYTSPFHTSDYLHYLASNFGLVKKADAANLTGFDTLNPVATLWIAFRNVAYTLFVIVFVVIGFAIMLRAKIDPRTVMTIENQIPKIIVALLLITFSFAIAGLMIDIMWLVIYLLINLGGTLDPTLKTQIGTMTVNINKDPYSWTNTLNAGFGGFFGIVTQAAGAVKDVTNVISLGVLQGAGFMKYFLVFIGGLPALLGCAISSVVEGAKHIIGLGQDPGAAFNTCFDGVVAGVVSGIVGAIAFIIFAVAIILALGRIWWALLKAYSLFLVYVIFGPIMIMMGVVPGAQVNFENWIRHIAAYLISFPTAIGILLFGKIIMDLYSRYSSTPGFVPPLLGVDGKTVSLLGPLLGFSIIMLLPQAVTMVQDALKAPDPKYLASVGQMLGAGTQFVSTSTNKVWERWTRPADNVRGLNAGWLRRAVFPTGSWRSQYILGEKKS